MFSCSSNKTRAFHIWSNKIVNCKEKWGIRPDYIGVIACKPSQLPNEQATPTRFAQHRNVQYFCVHSHVVQNTLGMTYSSESYEVLHAIDPYVVRSDSPFYYFI